jgi:hypothetical protein
MTRKLNFFLAKVDPNNNCTNGIVRTKSMETYLDYDFGNPFTNTIEPIRAQTAWDQAKYLNIWFVKEIIPDVAGYASFPFISNPGREGVVMGFDKSSKTLAHEIGHYLGLFHVWGCNTDETCDDNCGGLIV